MTRIFLSHKKRDRAWTLHLASQMKTVGFEAFVDEDTARGEGWRQRIDQEVEGADHLILVASPEAVVSEEVRRELALFLQRRQRANGEPRRLFVLMRAATPLPESWNMGQRGVEELTAAKYDAELRRIVEAVDPKAVARLASGQSNPHWHEAVRLGSSLRQRLLALLADWLKNDDDGTRELALAGALGLHGNWTRGDATAELRANAALVLWSGDDHEPIQKAIDALARLGKWVRDHDAERFESLQRDLEEASRRPPEATTPLRDSFDIVQRETHSSPRWVTTEPRTAHRNVPPRSPGPMRLSHTKVPRVFISYSRDSEAHTQAVYEFACGLRKLGLDAWTDHFEAFVGDWTSWMVRQVSESDRVLLICTERYRRLFEEETTEARGVPFEAVLLRALAYRENGRNLKCILVALNTERVEFGPLLLEGAMAFAWPRQQDALLRALWGVPDGVMPPIGAPQLVLPRFGQLEALVERSASLAETSGRDHAPERERVAWLQQELERSRAAQQDTRRARSRAAAHQGAARLRDGVSHRR